MKKPKPLKSSRTYKGNGKFAAGWKPTTSKKYSPDNKSPVARHLSAIAVRSKKVKITLATTPWSNEGGSND